MATICIIDDDSDVLATLSGFFERGGHRVLVARSGSEGVRTVMKGLPEVVILDLDLPDLVGQEVLSTIQPLEPVVLVLSGHVDATAAVEAMRRGAESVLTKPIDLELLGAATDRAIEKSRLRQMSRSIATSRGPLRRPALLGTSAEMRELGRQLELLARNDPAPVLILGENGTGKGRVAESLHALSPRATGPFVEVSCAGLAAGLLDAELFGGGRERTTDAAARERRGGVLDAADGGTLFLDEVGALDPHVQPKLLDVLDGKRNRRVDGAQERTVNVRLIAATARNLVTEIVEGRFREDFYYRISIMPVHLPPLRARAREDLLDVAGQLLDELHGQLVDAPTELSEEARDNLLRYSWPGNVRELRNVLERAMMLSRGSSRIEVEHLPPDVRKAPLASAEHHTPRSLAEVERLHIERTLRVHDQNRTRAARELGISRATLINKIKAYALERNGDPAPLGGLYDRRKEGQ